ncbi:S41 family peptidase [Cohnella silvisoli]|uniref:S41 family peptidase n=1 Tax=Cohnella silvisoli TaxID=2873699 RepID=A0ABV1KNN6_9BACL|nr:S41 family peptidase [Cohnella silvisoli]MCD9021022.1 S41 family peptidase [Cohnella silvisoli]
MKTLRKLRLSLALLLSVALFTIWTPAVFGESAEQIKEVRQLLEQYHLSKPNDDDLSATEIDKMVESLHDPYTEYFDEEQWKTFNSALEQTFVGVGIVMSEEKGTVYVEDVIPGSPAETAGVQPGDALVSADAKSFKGKSIADIQNAIRGEAGSIVALSVFRSGKTLTFNIPRKSLQIPIVTTRLLGNGVGYLALSGFTSDAGSQVKRQLAELEQSGLTSLVLDLRNNGGGYVNTAQEIASLFVKDGVLAHMRDRDGNDHPLEVKGDTKSYPVVILVNGNSASASELLAGALQDYGVAKLVGTKTFGKGVVQSIIPVQSGGMLKVTIQEYFTPLDHKVNKIGLMPDVVLEGVAEQLIGAYRLAGGQRVTLTSGKGVLTVNGVRIAQTGVAWQDKTVWYVNLKLAASIAGAKLTYDTKNHAYSLVKGTQTHTIKTNDYHLKINEGKSNIDVRLLAKWYSGLTFSSSGETLKLSAAK